jgi:RNA polymerase sigma-70 factor (ECF subfamily)
VARTVALAGQSPLRMDASAASARMIPKPLRSASERRREAALVREARAGSSEAMEAIFRAHWPRAYRAAYLVVHDAAGAEDIAQEAILAAIRALDGFDRSRRFGPWLHRIVVNRAIDWTRARSLRREVTIGEAAPAHEPHLAEPGDRPGDGDRELSDELVAAMSVLSPEHRAVVVLRYVLEYTPGEIARQLELPRGTVNSRLRRGLDRLRTEIGEAER